MKLLLMLAFVIATPRAAEAAAEPFDRAGCEDYILGPGGASLREQMLTWIRAHTPILLAPTNHRIAPVPFEELDEHFVAHRARGAASAERAAQIREARDLFDRFSRTPPAPEGPSTPLTPLQAAALGVAQPDARPVDELTTYLVARANGDLALETYGHERWLGEVTLEADRARVGYRGNPAYWVYREMQTMFDDQRDLKPAHFLADHALLAYSAIAAGRTFVYTIQAYEAGETSTGPWTAVNVEIYDARAVHPALVEEDALQIPPLRDASDRARRLTSVGLRLDRFVPTNED